MLEIQLVWAWCLARIENVRTTSGGKDRGEIVPWVLIVAVMAVAALAITAIIVAKVTKKANAIQL